jgi:hypothetical protein
VDPVALLLLIRALIRGRFRLGWRAFLVFLGLRRITPRLGEPLPFALVVVPALDTGGGYRPKWRPQDPAKDPREPFGSESSSKGSDHGWSNCTMTSGAVALAYQTFGALTLWGGDMRHEQGDLDGGTDLYDLAAAWEAYGETLKIRSGAGWDAVKEAHGEQRAVVIQGTGNVPGSGTFSGGHACCIGIETHSDGRWLWGDPCVSDWQWIEPGKIRDWAEAWQGSIAFATSRKVEDPEPEPEPEPPEPEPEPEPVKTYSLEELEAAVDHAVELAVLLEGDATVGVWLEWLEGDRPHSSDRWDAGAWADDDDGFGVELADDCAPGVPATWARGPIPYPVADALTAQRLDPIWDRSSWRAAAWMDW